MLANGDPRPRLAMWSTNDPVTLFGAGMSGRGSEQVSGIFRAIASRWSDCTDQRIVPAALDHLRLIAAINSMVGGVGVALLAAPAQASSA